MYVYIYIYIDMWRQHQTPNSGTYLYVWSYFFSYVTFMIFLFCYWVTVSQMWHPWLYHAIAFNLHQVSVRIVSSRPISDWFSLFEASAIYLRGHLRGQAGQEEAGRTSVKNHNSFSAFEHVTCSFACTRREQMSPSTVKMKEHELAYFWAELRDPHWS